MVLKLPWAQKRMLLAFEKVIFQIFSNFWVTKLKPFSRKVKQSVYNYLNQNLAIGSFLEKGFQAQKLMLWMFQKGIFRIFNNFWVAKLKPFSGIPRQCWKNFFDKVFFAQSILESAFQSLFDHSRQSLLEILNISNVLNVAIWIFNWS